RNHGGLAQAGPRAFRAGGGDLEGQEGIAVRDAGAERVGADAEPRGVRRPAAQGAGGRSRPGPQPAPRDADGAAAGAQPAPARRRPVHRRGQARGTQMTIRTSRLLKSRLLKWTLLVALAALPAFA